jgi:hypothetical protein
MVGKVGDPPCETTLMRGFPAQAPRLVVNSSTCLGVVPALGSQGQWRVRPSPGTKHHFSAILLSGFQNAVGPCGESRPFLGGCGARLCHLSEGSSGVAGEEELGIGNGWGEGEAVAFCGSLAEAAAFRGWRGTQDPGPHRRD